MGASLFEQFSSEILVFIAQETVGTEPALRWALNRRSGGKDVGPEAAVRHVCMSVCFSVYNVAAYNVSAYNVSAYNVSAYTYMGLGLRPAWPLQPWKT